MRELGEIEHLVFEDLGTATDDGGAGGIGRGALAATSAGTLTGAGNDSAAMPMGFSGAAWATFIPEVSLAMRGSLRVMLTEETAGATGRGV